jgi:hypothetical protein
MKYLVSVTHWLVVDDSFIKEGNEAKEILERAQAQVERGSQAGVSEFREPSVMVVRELGE